MSVCLVVGCHDQAAPPPPAPAANPPRSTVPERTSAMPDPPFTAEKITGEGKAMGTHLAYAAFTTPALDGAAVKRAFDAATREIERIEALMTTWTSDSDLARVNAAAGQRPVEVSKETYDVVAEALHTSEISEGTFDITFESLHGLWKFDQDLDPHPPTDAAIKAKLPLLSFRHVHLTEKTHAVYLDAAGVRISLGGIAKGYAVDRAAHVLDGAGIPSFFVQAGGDLFTRGKKPGGVEWSAGVRDPRGAGGSYFAMLSVTDHAFSTAGDYERSYVVSGKRFHHIIDPRTGYPATASRSVTIWAPTALLADGLDDAVFILGPEKGLKLVESIDDVGAVIVDAKNQVHVSKRLEGKLRVTHPPTDGI